MTQQLFWGKKEQVEENKIPPPKKKKKNVKMKQVECIILTKS